MNGRPPLMWVPTNYRCRYHKQPVRVIGPDGVWGVTSPGTGASAGPHACTDSEQIAEEIHAPDRAAQDTGEGGNNDYQDLGLEVDDDDPTDS